MDAPTIPSLDTLRTLVSGGLRVAGATVASLGEDVRGARPDDPLSERDPDYIRETLPAYRAVTDLWFRPKVRGLEHIPAEGPVLLVGNHSGGTLIADTFAFAYAFYSHFGPERPFHQLAHDMVFAVPGLGTLRKFGTIPASHDNGGRGLGARGGPGRFPRGRRQRERPAEGAHERQFGRG